MKKGFTLIEVIIVISLLSILIGSLSWIFVVGLRTWNSGSNRAEIRQDSNLALETVIRNLALASNITAAASDNITFSADVDEDSVDDTVSFSLDVLNKRLNRTINGTTTILASNVQDFALSYCQANTEATFTPLSQEDRDNIRVVKVALTMNKADETFALNSSAYTRNQGL